MTEEEDPMSDNDVPDSVHNRLLGAISDLYKQKRVKAPVRKELSYKVSEFHLTKIGQNDKKKGNIKLSDLTRVLSKRDDHIKINEQIKNVRFRSRKLPKPLEKPQAEKILRTVGYQNLKKDLNQWDAIVQQQRAAEHVSYPLTTAKVQVHNSSHDFLTTFSKPTELELELAKSIDEELQLTQKREEEKLEEKEFPLSLQEIKEQRSMMARLRAQLSYRTAKAMRQNKIKSKKYHRVLRKERMKQQIKEFEELQKTDPEAALKKLELLEKSRAQERASLRHRTTGQWARSIAVRAKYNKDARIALAEQLAQSRELTQKLKVDSSDDENNSDEVGEEQTVVDPNNTWLNKEQSSEVQEFYSNYKKYWDEEAKKKELQANNNIESVNDTDKALKSIAINSCDNRKGQVNGGDTYCSETSRSCLPSSKKPGLELFETPSENSNSDIDYQSTTAQTNRFVVTNKSAKKIQNSVNNADVTKQNSCTFTIQSLTSEVPAENRLKENASKTLKCKLMEGELFTKSGTWSVISINESNLKSVQTKPRKRRKKRNLEKKSDPSSFSVDVIKQVRKNSKLDFDEMFYNVEERLNEKVINKANRLKETISVNNSDFVKKSVNIDDNVEDFGSSLKMKKQRIQIDLDEKLNENADIDNCNEENSIRKTIERASVVMKTPTNSYSDKKTDNIEPNNFFHAKPKKLHNEEINNFATVEDKLDDVEDEVMKDERALTISEAFACDDVEEEFKNDKEEDIKKSAVEDVNMELPGWGSWGGPNIKNRPKFKTKRLIMKFPKVFPRRDENKGNVVVNEDKDEKIKPHLVTELPFPFTSVQEYEASIRAPIGGTFLPQSAHRKLIEPSVSTKLGTIIDPMTKDQILENKLDQKWC